MVLPTRSWPQGISTSRVTAMLTLSATSPDTGREQARLLGQRLAHLPIDAVWHSPLPRAADSAQQLNIFLTGTAP